MGEMARGLVIDLSLARPQEGYGRPVPVSEFEFLMSRIGSKLLTLSYEGRDIGYYIILSEQRKTTAEAIKAYHVLAPTGRMDRATYAWFDIVGITNEGRRLVKDAGGHAYTILDSAAAMVCVCNGIDVLFAGCRGGSQANTAIDAHFRRGFEDTGLTYTFQSNTPFHIIEKRIGGPAYRVRAERGTPYSMATNRRSFATRRGRQDSDEMPMWL
jgi:hypothetical protein